ncbi:MAG: hypothetical protein V1871_09610 [Planctomycetota bacterium]
MEQSELLRFVVKCFESLKIPYFITGSIASMAYGEPRLTNDIDIVADIKEKDIEAFKNLFPEDDFYITEEDIKEAIHYRRQFNVIHPSSGLKVDVIIPENSSFNISRFKRIKKIDVSKDTTANFSSPEDVIINKMDFYRQGGSEKHLRDITGIIKISGNILDMDYIKKWAIKLGLADIFDSILEKLQRS